MDPQDPSSFNARSQKLSTGKNYSFIDEKPANWTNDTPTILAIHGFPDRWYGWRYQIGPWVKRGWSYLSERARLSQSFRVIAPDTLGYGGTDSPKDLVQYTTKHICADFAALLDLEGIQKIILVAHDWGAELAWRFCLWYPNRVRMIASLAIPFYPPAPSYVSPEIAAKRVPGFGYQLYLGDTASTEEIESKIEKFVDLIYRSGNSPSEWAHTGQMRELLFGQKRVKSGQDLLTQREIDFYVEGFRSSMYGPLAYYKTKRLRFEEERDAKLPSRLSENLPTLLVRGTEDPSSPPQYARRAKNFAPTLQTVTLQDAGHWLMVERKDEVTKIVGDWIEATLKAEQKTTSRL